MSVNDLPKVATQRNNGASRQSNPGPRARIPSALTTRPLSHTNRLRTVDLLLDKINRPNARDAHDMTNEN